MGGRAGNTCPSGMVMCEMGDELLCRQAVYRDRVQPTAISSFLMYTQTLNLANYHLTPRLSVHAAAGAGCGPCSCTGATAAQELYSSDCAVSTANVQPDVLMGNELRAARCRHSHVSKYVVCTLLTFRQILFWSCTSCLHPLVCPLQLSSLLFTHAHRIVCVPTATE